MNKLANSIVAIKKCDDVIELICENFVMDNFQCAKQDCSINVNETLYSYFEEEKYILTTSIVMVFEEDIIKLENIDTNLREQIVEILMNDSEFIEKMKNKIAIFVGKQG